MCASCGEFADNGTCIKKLCIFPQREFGKSGPRLGGRSGCIDRKALAMSMHVFLQQRSPQTSLTCALVTVPVNENKFVSRSCLLLWQRPPGSPSASPFHTCALAVHDAFASSAEAFRNVRGCGLRLSRFQDADDSGAVRHSAQHRSFRNCVGEVHRSQLPSQPCPETFDGVQIWASSRNRP